MTGAGRSSGRLIRDVRGWTFPGTASGVSPPHRLRVWEFGAGELLAMVTEFADYVGANPAGVAAQVREDHPGREVEIVAYLPGTNLWFCAYRRLTARGPETPGWTPIEVTEYPGLVRRLGPPFAIDDEENTDLLAG